MAKIRCAVCKQYTVSFMDVSGYKICPDCFTDAFNRALEKRKHLNKEC